MRRAASYALMLSCALCLSPLWAAGKTEETGTARPAAEKTQRRGTVSEQKNAAAGTANAVSEKAVKADYSGADGAENPASLEQGSDGSGSSPAANEKQARAPEPGTKAADGQEQASRSEQSGKAEEPEDGAKKDAGDPTFASIQNTGLTVADGKKWYYESFDRFGRQVFAVLYEDGNIIEQIVWTYTDAARYPAKKQVFHAETSDIVLYDDAGRELVIEQRKGKRLTSKTENVYNSGGKLIEQTITAGKNTDKSVWGVVKDKAVSLTKYRNGKKTAFIELHTEPHIVHLYIDDKEVFVGEEQ